MHSRLVSVVVYPKNQLTSHQNHESHDYESHDHFVLASSVLDRITSVCEIDEHGTYFFPVRGPAKYFGGEKLLAEHVYASMSEAFADLSCGVGIADSRLLARLSALSSCGKDGPVITSQGRAQQLLAGVSISVLNTYCGIDTEIISLFERLGLYTLGDLAHIGETAFIDRFGEAGKNIYRLAVGDEIELFSPLDMGSPLVVDCDLDNLSHHSVSPAFNDANIVMSMLQPSIHQFMDTLQWNGMQCVQLRIYCETENKKVNNRIWYRSDGFDATSMYERVQWQITHWLHRNHCGEDHCRDADSCRHDDVISGITRVSIEALQCRKFHFSQQTLWGGRSENTERLVRSLSRISAVNNKISITVPQWCGGRDVQTFSTQPWHLVDFFDDEQSLRRIDKRSWNGSIPAPRPISLCDPPRRVHVYNELLQPVVVTSRHELSHRLVVIIDQHDQQWHVIAWAGPWPVEERWWDPQRRRRHARLQVMVKQHNVQHGNIHHENAGEYVVWLLSGHARQWHIVGVYD